MKKIGLLFATIIMMMLFAVSASAATEGYYTYKVENGEATITSVDKSISGDVTIPSTLGDYSVTSIGSHAFYSCDSLTSITIPDSVTSIGFSAFSCSKLTSITVDTNNKYYSSDSSGVLFDKNKTELIQYPRGNTSSSYVIPDSVISIGVSAFYECTGLTSVTIGNSVISIGESVFFGCTGLANVTISDSVISIGDYAFYECTGLTSVIIGNSVTSIGNCAFSYCISLTSITIPDGVTSIGDYAFYYCISLTSITIPDTVTTIGHGAFANCYNLKDVYFTGTEEQLNKITIYSSNEELFEATIHFLGQGESDTLGEPDTPDVPEEKPLNIFQRISQFFRNIFDKLFGWLKR